MDLENNINQHFDYLEMARWDFFSEFEKNVIEGEQRTEE